MKKGQIINYIIAEGLVESSIKKKDEKGNKVTSFIDYSVVGNATGFTLTIGKQKTYYSRLENLVDDFTLEIFKHYNLKVVNSDIVNIKKSIDIVVKLNKDLMKEIKKNKDNLLGWIKTVKVEVE